MRLDRLNSLVSESNYTKVQIAELSKVSRTTLDNVLAGADAKISTIESLARVLGVDVAYLFGEDEQLEKEIEQYKEEIRRLSTLLDKKQKSTKVVVELDMDDEEMIKLGLRDKLLQILPNN